MLVTEREIGYDLEIPENTTVEELRKQFAADFAEIFLAHEFANRGHGNAARAFATPPALQARCAGVWRIDENNPVQSGIGEVGDELRGHFAFDAQDLHDVFAPEKIHVVVKVVVLENGGVMENGLDRKSTRLNSSH